MIAKLKIALLCLFIIFLHSIVSANFPSSPHYGHWVYQAGSITGTVDLIKNNANFIGIKKLYHWKDIETAEGVYDFSEITSDLAELQTEGKRLWIQLSYTTWSSGGTPRTPTYMWSDSKYGGSSPYYGNYERTAAGGGWLPIIWNSEVQARFSAVYTALGASFSGETYVEGITVDETSTGIPTGAAADGYSGAAELAGFKVRALAAKNAFSDKTVLQHINYASFSRPDFAAWCVSNNIGIGCPDFRISSVTNSLYVVVYPMFIQHHDAVPCSPDAQWGNYEKTNPETGDYCTPLELIIAAHDIVDPYYFFWEKREPYFVNGVIPAVNTLPTLPITRTSSGAGVVDNGDTGTSDVGNWYVSSGSDSYGSGSLYCADSGGVYTYEKSVSGNYNVSVWWTSLSRRPTSATIKIYNGAVLLDTKTVNQQVNGGQWNLQGAYDFTGTAKVKILSGGGTARTCADAIKFESTGGIVIPSMSTQDITDVGNTTATGHGTIENTGGENCSKRGICWNTTGTPVADGVDSKSEDVGSYGTGAFSKSMTGLSEGTHYYARIYGYNSAGYGYGGQVECTTTEPSIPSGVEIIDNGDNGTTSTGIWKVSGGANPYGEGSLYSHETNATYTYENILSGNYEVSLWWTEWASRSTAVTVKIYNGAVLLDTKTINQQNNGGQWNVQGSYDFNATAKIEILSTGGATTTSTCADAVKFETTAGVVPPTVTTQAVTHIGDTIATFHGTITDLGGAANCTKRGFCWTDNPDIPPTISDNKTEENGAFGLGSYETNISNLPSGADIENNWIYVRYYAENSAGLVYGGQVEFEAISGYSNNSCLIGVCLDGCEPN